MFTQSAGFKPKQQRAGVVRGPGTGISDDVEARVRAGSYILPADSTRQVIDGEPPTPKDRGFRPGEFGANLSDGEQVLPPEQVQAIGEAVLSAVRDATHLPSGKGFRPGGRGAERPELFFADGSSPFGRWLERGRNQPVQRPSNIIKEEKVIADMREVRDQNARDSIQSGAAGFFANQSDESWDKANERARQAVLQSYPSEQSPDPAPTPTANDSPETKAWQDEQTALRNAAQSPANSSALGNSTAPATPPRPAASSTSATVPPTSTTPPPGWQKTSQEGIYQQGNAFTNVPGAASPTTSAQGFHPENAPSTPAAPGLGFASPGQPVLDANGNDMRRTMDMQRQIDTLRSDRAAENQGPRISVFGDRQQAERDRMLQEYRSLLMNPTLKDLQGSGFYGGRRGQTAGGGEYAARLGAFAQALGLDDKAAADRARNQTALEREQMQQSGADRRAAAGFAADQPYRDAQTEGLGFQNRAARQMENLRNKYFNARTPEEKNRALEALRAVNGGNENKDRFAIGYEEDESGRKTLVGFDKYTGMPVRTQQDGAQLLLNTAVDGFRYKGGDPKDKSNWEKI